MPFTITRKNNLYYVVNAITGKQYHKTGYKTKIQAQKLLTAITINYGRSKRSK